MDIIKKLAEELNIGRHQAEAAVKLIDEGNTIPFIARYRKEATGSLDDEVLRNLDERLKYLRNLEERKNQVIASIAEQEKLTPELERSIRDAQTLVAVEDLYRPYKPKRRTRAMIAKEKGLEPLADLISMQMVKEPLLPLPTFPRKRAWKPRKMPSRGPRISWQSASRTMRSTALISGMQP